ncbi:MAG: GH3 auxin-responsive promoter family protein [Bacteroidetes bacterium SB0662_bin_6]|nr:GH3 auxin-responsive promoter family protein [Bacteroidetes bacterium SB0668_bin_1]MYE04108.1 GH3 auxin-responsive promoter family protein [Bacteroidetes bacterium SB0662_bin_6]
MFTLSGANGADPHCSPDTAEKSAGWLPSRTLAKVEGFLKDPVHVQHILLRGLLQQAADTEWGRRYGFEEIARARDVVAAYQARVPLHTYSDFEEDIRRIRGGARDVIWPGAFRHFAVSSGTTSTGKIIPVSAEMLAANRRFTLSVGITYLARTGNVGYLLGKHVVLPGRIEEDPAYPGMKIGEVSGLQAEHTPFLYRHILQAVPNEVAFLPNWEEKLREIARRTVGKDVRCLIMVPSWSVVFFDELIRQHRKRFGSNARTVADVWPRLQVFIAGGVALSSYRELLQEKIASPKLRFLEVYGASEGFFSFQDDANDPAMLLHLDNGVFFEFVRMDEINDPNARRYTIGEVETGVRYGLFVSTCSGLWSYPVGDVVRFTDTSPHKIFVAGRTSEMIDKYGEAVFGEEARHALRVACERTGAHVRDFHVAPKPPEADRPPSHQWLVEFERLPDSMDRFSEEIDGYLNEFNRHYRIRREAQAFERPDVIALPPGTFHAWFRETREKVSGQTKVPRMREDRKIADAVIALLNSETHAGERR